MRSAMREGRDWRKCMSVKVMVTELPPDVQSRHIWEWFSGEGNIVMIDVFPSRRKDEESTVPMCASIKFEPPPRREFWVHRHVTLQNLNRLGPETLDVVVTLDDCRLPTTSMSRSGSNYEYATRIDLFPTSLDFGTMINGCSMKIMKTLGEVNGFSVKLELHTRTNSLTVYFPLGIQDSKGRIVEIRNCKFTISPAQMKHIYRVNNPSSDEASFIIPLNEPPRFFWRAQNMTAKLFEDPRRWRDSDAWFRATDVAQDLQAPNGYPLGLVNDIADPDYVEIGRWTTYRLVLDKKASNTKLGMDELQLALEDLNITVKEVEHFDLIRNEGNTMWSYFDKDPPATLTSAYELLMSTPKIQLPFEVRYQLEVCVSRGILNDHTITEEFLQKLVDMNPVKARLLLEYFADRNHPVHDPLTIFNDEDAESFYPNVRLPYYCAIVRKVIITPTTMRFNTGNPETSNRVIRRYNHVQDRFLRVQFVEDESESGRIMGKPQNDALWKRVSRVLYWGIMVGGRHYEFLAFGSSQLRQSGAYFFCPTDHLSCDDIRNWMGQLDHIKVVAKYAARLGQCFSTTREIRYIQVPQITYINDIERNGHCFTDGVGKISPFLASIVVNEMDMDIHEDPCAFQFRMGGCKGVLTVCPEVKGMEVQIRPSQEKFKADFNGLEIIRCSKFATATLNRQTITILESLGVDKQAFMTLLEMQMAQYEAALTDKKTAIELLTRFVDENGTTLILAELLKADFRSEIRNEPFVTNILNLWRSWSLKLLKEKSRIMIEQSAFVLGVVDEKGVLKGFKKGNDRNPERSRSKLPEIFLQISDPLASRRKRHKIIKGVCVVGRNPSLHPGDLQVVMAVDKPQLHHLKNVVVFPSTGDRPVPNMLSGGDLDGDDFFVIWDETLIPLEWNHPAMHYTGPEPVVLDRDVEVDDMRDFFVKYMQNDVLPLVAISHLAIADNFGPKSKLCIQLAELHSQAVDYPKTGQPAEWGPMHQARTWPHFMEKKGKHYISRKALGTIYDKVARARIEFEPDWNSDFDQRILKRFEISDDMLKEARKVKRIYDTAVRRMVAQHNLSNEFELWSGFAMSKPLVGTDYKRQEDLGHEYDALKQRFRELCYEKAGGNSAEKIEPFVAAMYKITEQELKIALFEHDRGPIEEGGGNVLQPRPLVSRAMPLITFPWIFHWVLIRIALGGNYRPAKSMLAAAKRDVTPPKRNKAQAVTRIGEQVGEQGKEEASEPVSGGPSDDASTDEAETIEPIRDSEGVDRDVEKATNLMDQLIAMG